MERPQHITSSSSSYKSWTAVRTSESWETAEVNMDPADHEQMERTKRDLENEEEDQPAKRLKSGGGEVYDETRERSMVTYPHLVDPVDDVNNPDTQLDDRHFSGLWDIVTVNALKDLAASQDENSDDGNSSSDGSSDDGEHRCTESSQQFSQQSRTLCPQRTPWTPSILPSIEISPRGTEADNSPDSGTNNWSTEQPYRDTTADIITSNDIAEHYPRTPSPRQQPLISSPYFSPISPSISQFIASVPSSTSIPQTISPTSHLGRSASPPPDSIPSASVYTYPEEEETREGVRQQGWIFEEEEEEEEWEGFLDGKEEEEKKNGEVNKTRKRKEKKVGGSIMFWRKKKKKKRKRNKV